MTRSQRQLGSARVTVVGGHHEFFAGAPSVTVVNLLPSGERSTTREPLDIDRASKAKRGISITATLHRTAQTCL